MDFWRITGIPPAEVELTPFLWQRLPGGIRALSIPKPKQTVDAEHFTLAPSGAPGPARVVIQSNALDHYEVREIRGPKAITKLAEVGSLPNAFALANAHVTHTYHDRLGLLRRDQAWRAHPVSRKQIEILRRFRIPHPERLNSGQASQLINYATLLRLNDRQAHVGRADEPATPGMRRYLRWLGITPEPGLTKREAGRLIRAGKAARLTHKRAKAGKEPVAGAAAPNVGRSG